MEYYMLPILSKILLVNLIIFIVSIIKIYRSKIFINKNKKNKKYIIIKYGRIY